MAITVYDHSAQSAVSPALGARVYGGAVIKEGRGVHPNVTRKLKVTWADGTRTLTGYVSGLDYPHRIVGVSTANGSAISSASALIHTLD